MQRLSIKGIGIALLVMIVVDISWGSVYGALVGGPTFGDEIIEVEFSAAMSAMLSSPTFLWSSMLLGTLSTVLGGYVTGRIAAHAPYFNAGVFGALGIVLGLLFAAGVPMWFNVLSFASTIPAALLGGHFALMHNRGRSAAAAAPLGPIIG